MQQRLIGGKRVSEAFTREHDSSLSFFFSEAERQSLPESFTANEAYNFISKCLHLPVIDFFTASNRHLDATDCGGAMVHDLVDDHPEPTTPIRSPNWRHNHDGFPPYLAAKLGPPLFKEYG